MIVGNDGGSAMTRAPQLRPLGAALGTEALGIDLSTPPDADTFAWIHAAFAEHPVLVFRDQDLGAPASRASDPLGEARDEVEHPEIVAFDVPLVRLELRERPSADDERQAVVRRPRREGAVRSDDYYTAVIQTIARR
jgi:hypothetical protein